VEGVEEGRRGVVLLQVGLDLHFLPADELDLVSIAGLLVGHFGGE
jgi:hypothetical protein